MNRDFLNQLIGYEELVSIYLYDNDPSVFLVGYISQAFEDAILLEVIRQDGKYDGYTIINLNAIYQIEYGTHYLKKLSIDSSDRKSFNNNIFKEYLLEDFIKYCIENKIILEIENTDLSIIGKIIHSEQEILVLNKINTDFHCFDGNIILRVDDIKCISFMGCRQNRYLK